MPFFFIHVIQKINVLKATLSISGDAGLTGLVTPMENKEGVIKSIEVDMALLLLNSLLNCFYLLSSRLLSRLFRLQLDQLVVAYYLEAGWGFDNGTCHDLLLL